jgi:hypothetical protein
VKKRLTFKFLPWVAAAGVCVGGTFVRGQTPAAPAEGSVLTGKAAAAAPVEAGEAAAADACMQTVKRWR